MNFRLFSAYWAIDALIVLLHILLPARVLPGYATDWNGKPLIYRLNGVFTLLTSLSLWYIFSYHWHAWTLFYDHMWTFSMSGCILGLILSAILVFFEPVGPESQGALIDFFNGRAKNPQLSIFGRNLDFKMALYIVGIIQLELNILSAFMHHRLTHWTDPNPGITLYTFLFSFWVLDYCSWEHPHVYTYDLVAEYLGFKIVWGCLCFYPYFYAIGILSTASKANPHPTSRTLVLSATMFFAGWVLSRGANNQKWYFKMDPRQSFLGIKPLVIQSKDGTQKVLCSGFWGLSRHVNYLGELLISTGLAMSLGHLSDWRPWLYPLYYVALLIPRQMDDDKRCEEKYGEVWKEYCRKVPWRIVPGVY
jgi:hypothetical protein